MSALSHATKPANVPDELVFEFDLFNIPGSEDDVQAAMHAVQQSRPDIFWTPLNGGHWVATRAEDIEVMQKDFERFSTHNINVPPKPDSYPRGIPLELDPPRHTPLRRPLTAALLPRAVNELEGKVRELTVELIEGFAPDGECEFISQFAKVLPICVFLDLVDLPREDRHFLLPITDRSVRGRTVEGRQEAQEEIFRYIGDTVRKRRASPGNDLLSPLVNATEGNGQKISEDDAIAYATLVLFGGLDTVAGMLGFVARFLAQHPVQRQELVKNLEDERFVRDAIEELLRRHGIASTTRMATHDFDYKGLHFRKGDMILPPNMLVGLDDRRVPDPLTVNFRREAPARHAIFGNGDHICPGAILARRELKIFLEEWLKRIPDFSIKPGTRPVSETGSVSGILELQLAWPT